MKGKKKEIDGAQIVENVKKKVKKAHVEGFIPYGEVHHLLMGIDMAQQTPRHVFSFSLRKVNAT